MDYIVNGVSKSRTRLRDFHFHLLKGWAPYTFHWGVGLQPMDKQRHYFANKGPCTQSYGFSSTHVWVWELDHKAEHRRTDAFEMWCWRKLLRVPRTVPWFDRRSNQSILKEISPKYLLEELMLKLKLQYFGQLMPRGDSFEKTLMLGMIEGGRRRGRQRMRWLDGITDSVDEFQ